MFRPQWWPSSGCTQLEREVEYNMQKQTKKPKTDYLILYTYIYCQDARDLDIIVFCFWFFGFVVAYCTQLLSQAMYNLMMATTMAETCSCQLPSTIQLHNNYNIVVFDYFIHSLYIVINTQRGCLKIKILLVAESTHRSLRAESKSLQMPWPAR